MKKSHTFIKTNLGKIYIEATTKSLVKVNWTNIKIVPKKRVTNPLLINAKKQLISYFKGKKFKFNLPLNPTGTRFQKRVWKYIEKINWGEKKSYGDISKKIFNENKPMGARAIGNACSNNPILIVIPCHRVISSNGTIGGYKKSLSKKRKLLILEKSLIF